MYTVYIYNLTKQHTLEVERLLALQKEEELNEKRKRIAKNVLAAQGGCDKEKFTAVFTSITSHLELAFLMIMQAFQPVYAEQQSSPNPKTDDELKEMVLEQLRPALQRITEQVHTEFGVTEKVVESFANDNNEDPEVKEQIAKLANVFENGVDLMFELPACLDQLRMLEIFEKIAKINAKEMKKGVTQAHLDGRNVASDEVQHELQGEVAGEVALQTKLVYKEYGLVSLPHLPEVIMQAGLMQYQQANANFANKIQQIDAKQKRQMGVLLASLNRRKKVNKGGKAARGRWD
jgi:hypothetical protein